MSYENTPPGSYEQSEGSGVGTALTFLLIGLGAGVLVGLLYAPRTGKQMRKELRRRYQDARGNFDDWADQARDIAEEAIGRGSDIIDDLRDRVAPVMKNIRR